MQPIERTPTVTGELRERAGRAAMSPDPRSEKEEPGEIDMVSRTLATLDLVARDDAQQAFPAVLAALRLGHAVAFLPASIDHELLEPPDTGTGSWLQPRSVS